MTPRLKDINFGGFYARYIFLLASVVVTLLVYSNVLNGDPQFDDEEYLFHDPLLKSPANFAGKNLLGLFISGQRPLASLTFAFNYYFWGENTYSYHIVNLFIHITNGILLYFFISVTLRQPPLRERYLRISAFLPAMVVLTFLIHPIQTQAVSYIVQRGESLASMFYLISMLSFALSANADTGKKIILNVLFVGAFILGLGSKQIAVTIPLTALIYGIIFFDAKSKINKLLMPVLMLILGIILSIYALTSLNSTSAGFSLYEFTAYEYFLTELRVIWTYLRMLLLPVGQSIDHLYPVSRSILTLTSLLSAFATVALLLVAIFFHKKMPAESFFCFWFFIILMPTSTILPLKEVMVEHRLYLASVGIYFVFFSFVVKFFFCEHRFINGSNKILFSILIGLSFLVFLGSATYKRNVIWSDRLLMWQDVVRKYPKSARGHHNLGNCYMIKKDYKNALNSFLMSMNLAVANVELYYNVGKIFEDIGMDNLAHDFFTFFIAYSGGGHEALRKKLVARYNIGKDERPADIVQLKKKAIDVYNMMYTTGTH